MGENRNVYKLLAGKTKGKRPLGRSRHGWVDNINMALVDTDGVVRTGLVWLRIGKSGELL
jgi:hypothetical protein